MRGDDDRAQAFTLEGLMSGILVLIAVLYAMQAVTTAPGATGAGSEDARQLRGEADDILATAATRPDRDLSYAVRHWSSGERKFVGAVDRETGYGAEGPPDRLFGGAFARTFASRGLSYNVVLRYRTDSGDAGSVPLVHMGPPGENAVSAGRRVTLYDNQTLTGSDSGSRELWEYDIDPSNGEDGFYPVPDAVPGSPVYNVVEVRVVVW